MSDDARTGAPPAPPARRARVLVVDDDELVARTVVRILSRRHDVEVVADAPAALARIARGGIDAVLCDVFMPGMTGPDLRDALAPVAPDLARRMVFMTGGAFTPRAAEALARSGNARIEKPFTPDRLLEVVARALEG